MINENKLSLYSIYSASVGQHDSAGGIPFEGSIVLGVYSNWMHRSRRLSGFTLIPECNTHLTKLNLNIISHYYIE